jgi:hypothetical protein
MKGLIALLGLGLALSSCGGSAQEKVQVRGEIEASIPMSLFTGESNNDPVWFFINDGGNQFLGHLTEEQIQNKSFKKAWSTCNFVLSPTGEKDTETGKPLYKIEAQSDCVSNIK